MNEKDLPIFETPFKIRVKNCWKLFLEKENELRLLMDNKASSDEIVRKLDELISPAFNYVYAEVGKNNDKYELILNLDGDKSRAFPLIYFKNNAPKEVFEHWNILIGRQASQKNMDKLKLRMGDSEVEASDIDLWCEWENNLANVSVYCEKLLPLLKQNETQAYNIVYMMIDYAVSELAEMKYIDKLELIETPKEGSPIKLSGLMENFTANLSYTEEEILSEEKYLDSYCGYRMEPDEKSTDGKRKDVFVGSTRLIPLLSDFMRGDTYTVDNLNKDGIAAGYLVFPLYGFTGENRGAQILDFRDMAADKLEQTTNSSFTFLGGASGINYGYIDFLSYDLKETLDNAIPIFKEAGIDWLMFHNFRQDAEGVTLYEEKPKKGIANVIQKFFGKK